jgi:hypothetical protein
MMEWCSEREPHHSSRVLYSVLCKLIAAALRARCLVLAVLTRRVLTRTLTMMGTSSLAF